MKKCFVLSSLLLLITGLFAQSAPEKYTTAMQLVKDSYNQKDYAKLHGQFNAQMAAALPMDKLSAVFDGLHLQLGKISENSFLALQEGTASYKSVFENDVVETRLFLDEKGLIGGLRFMPYVDKTAAIVRNTTGMALPFKEEWFVFWGGDTEQQNYHVVSPSQKNAFDFIILDKKGQSYKKDGAANDDYYAFGKNLYAPCNGEVVTVIDGIADNIPGQMNPLQATGNTVVIKTINNEYVLLAHFKQNSIKVKNGDQVVKGQLLGLCGNSGNSSEPHLHFHIQNAPLEKISAIGIKCFFETAKISTIAGTSVKQDYSPLKGDKVKPVR